MPVFGSPFSGLSNDRKLTDEELVRAIRFMVAAEYEAVQLYMQLAESADSKLAVEVLKDIADEERVHAGEFLRLLHELAPTEEKFYAKGAQEVEAEIEKMKQWIRRKSPPQSPPTGMPYFRGPGLLVLKHEPLGGCKKSTFLTDE
jgi:rubrerythrin